MYWHTSICPVSFPSLSHVCHGLHVTHYCRFIGFILFRAPALLVIIYTQAPKASRDFYYFSVNHRVSMLNTALHEACPFQHSKKRGTRGRFSLGWLPYWNSPRQKVSSQRCIGLVRWNCHLEYHEATGRQCHIEEQGPDFCHITTCTQTHHCHYP